MSNQPRIRERRRYIAIQIESHKTFMKRDIKEAIWDSVFKLFGEYGASQTSLEMIEYDPEKKQAIIRCSHLALELVKASLVAVVKINNEKSTIHIIRVSGTIKSLRRKMKKNYKKN